MNCRDLIRLLVNRQLDRQRPLSRRPGAPQLKPEDGEIDDLRPINFAKTATVRSEQMP